MTRQSTTQRQARRGSEKDNHRMPPLLQQRNPILRFFNPWVDVAYLTKEPAWLGTGVAQYTETWGLVSVLLCGLSLTALVSLPHEEQQQSQTLKDDNENENDDKNRKEKPPPSPAVTGINRQQAGGLVLSSYVCPTPTSSSSSSSSSSLRQNQHDVYIVSCVSAFFASASSLGLSTVLNVLATVTPQTHLRDFVISHSWQLCSIPCLTATSGGLIGLALLVGVEMTQYCPDHHPHRDWVSKIAMAEFGITTLVVACSGISGQFGLFRALSARNILLRRSRCR